MQSIEAIISLMVLVLIVSYMLTNAAQVPAIDDSLYRYQLTNDVWRVLYLKGDFYGFGWSNSPVAISQAAITEGHLNEIDSQTGLCFYLGGMRTTSCRGISGDIQVGTINKIMFVDGLPKQVTLTVAKHID